jgi:hypothetical protein
MMKHVKQDNGWYTIARGRKEEGTRQVSWVIDFG